MWMLMTYCLDALLKLNKLKLKAIIAVLPTIWSSSIINLQHFFCKNVLVYSMLDFIRCFNTFNAAFLSRLL